MDIFIQVLIFGSMSAVALAFVYEFISDMHSINWWTVLDEIVQGILVIAVWIVIAYVLFGILPHGTGGSRWNP